MIQRKQTLYLLISVIISVICLYLPVGRFVSSTITPDHSLYNLWLKSYDGSLDFSGCILFALLLLTCTISIVAIFTYSNRKRQGRMCLLNIFFLIAWYAAYFFTGFVTYSNDNTEFRMLFTAAFPAVSLILNVMARKAILADEALVRSADRIR